MGRPDVIKCLALSLLACLFLIQSANGAEKNLVIKLATLAPEGSSWMNTFNTINTEVMKNVDILLV